MVESYERGSTVVLKANPHYWDKGADGKPLPYLDGVELNYVPESNSRVLGLRNGDYDVISQLPSTRPSLSRPIATSLLSRRRSSGSTMSISITRSRRLTTRTSGSPSTTRPTAKRS